MLETQIMLTSQQCLFYKVLQVKLVCRDHYSVATKI